MPGCYSVALTRETPSLFLYHIPANTILLQKHNPQTLSQKFLRTNAALFPLSAHFTFMVMCKSRSLYLLLGLLFLVIAFINPLREMLITDDWAYGLTVRNLLATGEYHLNSWAAANMPVQVYWAAFLTKIFGYTFSILRLSTLALLLLAIVSLYCLLRDFGVAEHEAGLLTLAMVASPPVLFLSFTFQTDVQFLGWQIPALWLYSRALRQNNYLYMAGGALAAAAAVGTRQFGVALVAGLLGTWLLVERQRVHKTPFYLIGLGLPLLATVWQLAFGLSQPTFSQNVRLAEQRAYLSDLSRLLGDFFWRPTVILQYLALYLFPILPLFVILARRAWKKDRMKQLGQRLPWGTLVGPLAWCTYIVAGACFGYFVYLRHVLMPYIAWLLPNNQTTDFGFRKHLILTLSTCAFAAALGWLLSRRYLRIQNWRQISNAEWLIAFSGLALFGFQLIYAQFYDVYLIQFIPFVLVAVGGMFPRWPAGLKTAICGLSVLTLVTSSLWTRGNLARAEANWKAADIAGSAAATPEDVGGNMTWSCYHGAFDTWVQRVGGIAAAKDYSGSHRMHFAFFAFLNQGFDHAPIMLSKAIPGFPDDNWRLIATIPYRDELLRPRDVYVIKKK